jgi:hypothetical protein
LSRRFIIQERLFALTFTRLRTFADARCFEPSALSRRYADLQSFTAKILQTVEKYREFIPLDPAKRFNSALMKLV